VTRRDALVGIACTIALGLASRRFPIGLLLWDKSFGDALYTVMIYFVVAAIRPTLQPVRLGVSALAISLAIELFQLTGIPLGLPRVLRLALGTTFAWHDVACYFVGAGAIVLGHGLALRACARAP
jgi:hypothetical protein